MTSRCGFPEGITWEEEDEHLQIEVEGGPGCGLMF